MEAADLRLYFDENFPRAVGDELRRLGTDVITALADGRANRMVGDPRVLDRAAELGRAVVTLDRDDYRHRHERRPDHAGIIICTRDDDAIALARRIVVAVAGYAALNGCLVRVIRPNTSPAATRPAT